jgi:hypothetical protein
VARRSARRMAGANGVKKRAAPSQQPLKAASDYCRAHGGGKRCQQDGCLKSAQGDTGFCKAHGGGKRCQEEGCTKSARGDTGFCVAHGGGRRCQHAGCPKSAATTDTQHCVLHGGGKAVPALGLRQGRSRRRHATLHPAWGRQALPAGGLYQDSLKSSRQCVLHAMSPARAARRCVGRYTITAWRGPGAPSHGWDRGADAITPPAAAGGECGATHRLATAASDVYVPRLYYELLGFMQQRARNQRTPLSTARVRGIGREATGSEQRSSPCHPTPNHRKGGGGRW